MRRVIYSTSSKKPEGRYFANMCNIAGTEEICGTSFLDWLYDKYSLLEDDLDEESYDNYFDEYRQDTQQYKSPGTSINSGKLLAIFTLVTFQPDTINLDYGGGKFDNAAEYLAEKYGATNLVYDPYNRSKEHNAEVIKQVRANGGADTVTLSNVLNVIKEAEVRESILRDIKKLVKPSGTVYITVYEGSGTSEGKATQNEQSYQLNRKTADYLEEIQEVFPDAVRKGKLIIAHPTGSAVASSTDITAADYYNMDPEKAAAAYTSQSDPATFRKKDILEVPFESDIHMNADGSWDYLDEVEWVKSGYRGSDDWYDEELDIYLEDPTDVQEDVDFLLMELLPVEEGDFHISGVAKLAYEIEGYLDENDEVIAEDVTVDRIISESSIDNFKIEKI